MLLMLLRYYLDLLRVRVTKAPPINPPKCPRQSTPPNTKPIAKLSQTIIRIDLHSTPALSPTKARAPKSPKIIPDAPIE